MNRAELIEKFLEYYVCWDLCDDRFFIEPFSPEEVFSTICELNFRRGNTQI